MPQSQFVSAAWAREPLLYVEAPTYPSGVALTQG